MAWTVRFRVANRLHFHFPFACIGHAFSKHPHKPTSRLSAGTQVSWYRDTEGKFQGFLPDLWGWEMSAPSKACWVIIIRASPRILTPCPTFFLREKWLSKQVVHSCPGWLWSGSKPVWYFPLSPFGDQLTVSFEQTAPFWKGFYRFRMSITLFPFVPFC